MTWNYRVIENNGSYSIYETYYDKRGSVEATTVDPCCPHGLSLAQLREEMRYYRVALSKPVLHMATLEKSFERMRKKIPSGTPVSLPAPPPKDIGRIVQFVLEFMRSEHSGGKPNWLVVRHLRKGDRRTDKIGEQWVSDLSENQIESLAYGIYQSAEDDSIRLKGRQRYVIQAYCESDRSPTARFVFSVNPGERP